MYYCIISEWITFFNNNNNNNKLWITWIWFLTYKYKILGKIKSNLTSTQGIFLVYNYMKWLPAFNTYYETLIYVTSNLSLSLVKLPLVALVFGSTAHCSDLRCWAFGEGNGVPEHMPTHDLVLTDWAVLGMGRRAPDGPGNVLGVREEWELRASLNQVRPGDLQTCGGLEGWGPNSLTTQCGAQQGTGGITPTQNIHSHLSLVVTYKQ